MNNLLLFLKIYLLYMLSRRRCKNYWYIVIYYYVNIINYNTVYVLILFVYLSLAFIIYWTQVGVVYFVSPKDWVIRISDKHNRSHHGDHYYDATDMLISIANPIVPIPIIYIRVMLAMILILILKLTTMIQINHLQFIFEN